MAQTAKTKQSGNEVIAGDISTLPAAAKASQIAEFLQTSEAALAQDRYMNRGLPYVRVGGRIRYMRSDLEQYLAANRQVPNGAA